MTYGNGTFVVIGNNLFDVETIITSPDGATWTHGGSGIQGILKGITYGNGTFVSVGTDSSGTTMFTSPHGTEWTNVPSNILGPTIELSAITYGNSTFVAAGYDSSLGSPVLLRSDPVK